MEGDGLKLYVTVPFPSGREAEIAYNVLRVDREPPRSQITKTLTLNKNNLIISFTAPTVRQLRVGVNGYLDHLMLVSETMHTFGPPFSHQYSYS